MPSPGIEPGPHWWEVSALTTAPLVMYSLFVSAPEIQIDESVVMQLVSMGFDKEGCRKAVYHTNNQGMSSKHKFIFSSQT